MSTTDTLAPLSAIGELHLDIEGCLEGWCWYPDQPDTRATVELLLDGDVVRVVRATRLRPALRDLGMGDGHYGFRFLLPVVVSPRGPRTVLELRERRLGTTVGRIVLGSGDPAREGRLDVAASVLATIAGTIDGFDLDQDRSAIIEGLGRTLLHLAARSPGQRAFGLPGLQAGLHRLADLPSADLGWCTSPQLSVIVPAAGDIRDIAARLRGAIRMLRGVRTEFLLLDDGSVPLAMLLPTLLRGLRLVRTPPLSQSGASLNAAAAAARGEILAFARPGGPGLADLPRAAELPPGALGLDASLATVNGVPGPARHHGLDCVVSRADLAAMGGFDPVYDRDALWDDLLAKAEALDLIVTTWEAPPRARLSGGCR